jgi:serine/threonine protein phosphatase PrpC
MHPETLTDTADYVPAPRASTPSPGPSSSTVRVDLAGLSHPGKVRPNNEDNFLVVRFGRFLQTMLTSLPEGNLAPEYEEAGYGIAVADGMGGMAGGEVASRLAITLLVNLVLETPDWIMTHEEPYADEVAARAVDRFEKVNRSILEHARREPWLRGMGTTLTMACSLGTNLLIAHVGDSPVILSRGGKLQRLTRDHTLAQQMAEHGSIPVEDVPSRYRHMLTQAIGIRENGGEPDIHRLQLEDGDRLLLCTDGLTDMVDDATIVAELHHRASSSEACQALVDLALDHGGRDNVTAVVASYRIEAGA